MNLIDKRFGKLVVVSQLGNILKCKCDCGGLKITKPKNVLYGTTKSCGCLRRDPTTHGMSNTKTYYSWVAMKNRCENPKNDRYKNYGGRGISFCKRWESFENFLKDMGERPKGMTLDRINVNGNYNPKNCRWANNHDQYRNMVRNRFITLKGVTKIVSDWAKEFNTTTTAIQHHLNHHKGLEFMYEWRLKHNRQVPEL